ncbi:Deoxyadenosine kinase / Deoxyguanosine kinase [Mycoplasmopsis meleagridis]|uniref:Deoxyadenosine kinase /Deoxyguanosine kinase n=1 Tax=Mycoplasmopsis meleagridis ATCC 25294 TaxID=1264554 RepID=A0A0F5H0P6_9BACT|nr:deoxynucleoside kinase [Mycoplasmopsis meleagridis]KKB26854.1 Deoxyadenosine kinase /Deoxyguanosine kinase [Mycoplasmopsis meleagridis ATCC 25294]KUH47400.1 deoxyguanosine kinase [Mycoplasmopsis meleagridis]OAD18590.1 Deoxyadenosine kinase / Deoxyguanosine kinase [Mycoplasmopsis meleagridis]VEU77407.1 Deoxyguanosine kinase [Mycoplasmopsis meleagridis]
MIIGISGMISSGKSTVTEKLVKSYPNARMLAEFEENNEVFNTFLKWLYEKKENLTIGFQSYVVENHTSLLFDCINDFKNQGFKFSQTHLFLDRFSIEHYIFANVNLRPKGEKYLKGYDALFSTLITEDETPDLAIYLDMSFETFKKRLFQRGREVETKNWELNKEYFKELYDLYKPLFMKQAEKYNLDYVIVDTNDLSEEEVFIKVKNIIDNFDFTNKKRYKE